MSMMGDRIKALEALEAQKLEVEKLEAQKLEAEKLEAQKLEKASALSDLGFNEKSIGIIKNLASHKTSFTQPGKDNHTLMDIFNEILSVDDGDTYATLLDIIRCIIDKNSEKAKAKNPDEIEWQVLGLKQLANEKIDEIIDEAKWDLKDDVKATPVAFKLPVPNLGTKT